MTGEIKAILIEVLQKFVGDFQARRKLVTQKDVELFMSVRKIDAMPKRFATVPAPEQTNSQV